MKFAAVVRRWFAVKKIPKGKLRCNDCGRHIHKRDRYKILAVQHVDCMDPRKVGQTSIPLGDGK